MDRARSRQRANPVGAHQSEHKLARTSQALEPTKEPFKLAPVNLLCRKRTQSCIKPDDFAQDATTRLGPQIYTVQSKRFETVSGLPHSKTLRKIEALRFARQRLGVRQPYAAFGFSPRTLP